MFPIKKIVPFLFISAIAVALALTCTKAPVAGDATETGNAAVAGLIINANLYPAHHTLVRLVPSAYDPVLDETLPDSLSDSTDSQGRYSIKTKRTGTFNVLAFNFDDSTSALIKNITLVRDSAIENPTGILSRCGALLVQVPRRADSTNGYVYIMGTTFSCRLHNGAAGAVLLSGVPACTTAGVYYSSTDTQAAPVLLAGGAVVVSGDTSPVFLVNRGVGLFIGIDDGGTGYPIVRKNNTLFEVYTLKANGGVTNGWYGWSPGGGAYLSARIAQADTLGLRPAVIYQAFSETSFDSILAEFNNVNYMNSYFTQYIAALRMIAGKNALLVLEPITTAFCAQRAFANPTTCTPPQEFANVKSSRVSEVQSFPDNEMGLMQACISLAHSIAPDASVGIFLMNWALKTSASSQELVYWTQADQDSNVREWVKFIGQLNILDNVDFISLGKNRSDAGYTGVNSSGYWNSPQFASFLTYSGAIHRTFNKPLVGWYLPVGHRGLPNTANRYEDTFAEYFFANSKSFSDAGFCGMLFGKYDPAGTDLSETQGTGDDGWFINQLKGWK
jgi:hypothetical protein